MAVVGALVLLTVYLPARRAAAQGNTVVVDGMSVRLSAGPDRTYEHGVSLEVTIAPEPGSDAVVQLAPCMPTMGNMAADVGPVSKVAPGVYRGSADLGMAGLWQVQVVIQRPGLPDAVARFRLNA